MSSAHHEQVGDGQAFRDDVSELVQSWMGETGTLKLDPIEEVQVRLISGDLTEAEAIQ